MRGGASGPECQLAATTRCRNSNSLETKPALDRVLMCVSRSFVATLSIKSPRIRGASAGHLDPATGPKASEWGVARRPSAQFRRHDLQATRFSGDTVAARGQVVRDATFVLARRGAQRHSALGRATRVVDAVTGQHERQHFPNGPWRASLWLKLAGLPGDAREFNVNGHSMALLWDF
jgi:hypothetical protein